MTTNLSRPSAPRPAFVDVPACDISSRASNRPPRVPARFLDSPRASRDDAAELIRTSSRRRAAPRRARSRVSVVDRAARRRASAAVASRAARASSSSVARAIASRDASARRPRAETGRRPSTAPESRRVLNRRVCVCVMFFINWVIRVVEYEILEIAGGGGREGGARAVGLGLRISGRRDARRGRRRRTREGARTRIPNRPREGR